MKKRKYILFSKYTCTLKHLSLIEWKYSNFFITFETLFLLSTGHKTMTCIKYNTQKWCMLLRKHFRRDSKIRYLRHKTLKTSVKNHYFFCQNIHKIRSALEEKCVRTYWRPLKRKILSIIWLRRKSWGVGPCEYVVWKMMFF